MVLGSFKSRVQQSLLLQINYDGAVSHQAHTTAAARRTAATKTAAGTAGAQTVEKELIRQLHRW